MITAPEHFVRLLFFMTIMLCIAFVLLVLLLYLLVRKLEDTKRVIRRMEGQTTQWPRDTKRVIRSRKWKDRQHNGKKKKVKSTNNDLENIKQNTKD